MATYGYIENKTAAKVLIESLALSLPAGYTEVFDEEDVRPKGKYIHWERAIPELEALVTAGTIEIREADDLTIVPAAGVEAWVDTEVVTLSSLPTNINNEKIDISTSGKALITKAAAGTGVSLDSTGADPGTGVVTINVDASVLATTPYTGSLTNKIVGPSGSIAFLEHDGVLHSEAGFYLTQPHKLVSMVVNAEVADGLSNYELILYRDPSGTPVEVYTISLDEGERVGLENGIDEALAVGEYGLALKKITPNLQAYDNFILSLGPEAYYRLDEIPAPPLYDNNHVLLDELASNNTWITTTLPVPTNSIVQIAISNIKSDDGRVAGVRAVGSAVNRSFDMQGPKDVNPAANYTLVHVVADASSQVQLYAEDTGEIRFIVVGHWESGTYVEKNNAFQASASGSWVTLDLSSVGVGADDIVELALANYEDGVENTMGVRAVGSSLERKFELKAGKGMDKSGTHATMTVVANASGQVEVWTADHNNTRFRVLGYWSTPPDAEYTETWESLGTPTTNDVWDELGLSTPPPNGIADIYIENSDINAVDFKVGARTDAVPQGTTMVKRDGVDTPWVYYLGSDQWGDQRLASTAGQFRTMRSAASQISWKSVVVGVSDAGRTWIVTENHGIFTSHDVGVANQTYWWLGDASFTTDGSDIAVIVYANGNNLELRTWDGTTLSSPTTITSDVAPGEVSIENDPSSGRFLIAVCRTDNTAQIWEYDHTTTTLTGPHSLGTLRSEEAIDIMFTRVSHVAHIVYGKSGSGNLYYKTYDNGVFGTEQTITAPTTHEPYFIRMAYWGGTDELAVAVTTHDSGGSSDAWVARFNGTTWGDTALVADNLNATTNYPACAIEFEQVSGNLLAAYSNSGSNSVAYRTWSSGSGWSGELAGPDVGSQQATIGLWHENHTTDHIVLIALLANSDVESSIWLGSSWSSVTELSDNSGETKNQPFTFHHYYTEEGRFVDRWFYASDAEKGLWNLSNLYTPLNQDNDMEWWEDTNSGTVDFKLSGYWTPTTSVQMYDKTANNHDGEFVGGVLLQQTGRIAGNAAASYDGINDHSTAGTWNIDGDGLSIKAWVKIDTLPGAGNSGRIVYKGDATNPVWALEINNNHPRFIVKASGSAYTIDATTTILTTGTWYLIVGTFDEATGDLVLYVDGVEVESTNTGVIGATLDTSSDPIYLAARTPTLGLLDATLDEVAIFPTALTAEEVDDIWDHRDEIVNPDSYFSKAWACVQVVLNV